MARLINPEGGERYLVPADGKIFTLEELQKAVGGYIEIVKLNDNVSMVIDEDGKNKDLDFNPTATTLAKLNKAIFDYDYIVGPAVFVLNRELD